MRAPAPRCAVEQCRVSIGRMSRASQGWDWMTVLAGLIWAGGFLRLAREVPPLGVLVCLLSVTAIALLLVGRSKLPNIPPLIRDVSLKSAASPGWYFGPVTLALCGAALGLMMPEARPTLVASVPAARESDIAQPRVADAGVTSAAVDASAAQAGADGAPDAATTPDEAAARFRAMTGPQHVAAAREALALGCPPRGAGTGNLDEAARHFGALSPRVQQGRDGRAISAALARCMASRMGPELRDGMANTLATRLAASGMMISGALATDADKTTVRIISPQCSRSMASAIARTYGASLRGVHFRLLECKTPGHFSGETNPVSL